MSCCLWLTTFLSPEWRQKFAMWNLILWYLPTSIHLPLMRNALIKKHFHCQGCLSGRRLAGCAVGATRFPHPAARNILIEAFKRSVAVLRICLPSVPLACMQRLARGECFVGKRFITIFYMSMWNVNVGKLKKLYSAPRLSRLRDVQSLGCSWVSILLGY